MKFQITAEVRFDVEAKDLAEARRDAFIILAKASTDAEDHFGKDSVEFSGMDLVAVSEGSWKT